MTTQLSWKDPPTDRLALQKIEAFNHLNTENMYGWLPLAYYLVTAMYVLHAEADVSKEDGLLTDMSLHGASWHGVFVTVGFEVDENKVLRLTALLYLGAFGRREAPFGTHLLRKQLNIRCYGNRQFLVERCERIRSIS